MSTFISKPVATLKPYSAESSTNCDKELKLRIDLNTKPDITALPSASLEGAIVGEASFHPDLDVMAPPTMIPYLKQDELALGTTLEDVQRIDHDAMHEQYAYGFHGPTIKALKPDVLSTVLPGVTLVTDRHMLRNILRACYYKPKDAYYSVQKDFTIVVTNIHGKVLLTPGRDGSHNQVELARDY
ncbi:hypothetical protein EON65_29345 [archaeon]|nr:MAG: hypothetical protein EON65_29345 [archaeon]